MLRVAGLRCAYTTGPVLAGIDLHVEEGELVGLLGRNGMGKTSLVRCVMGLTPPQVTAGSISFDGQELTGLKRHEIARLGLGLVPQGRHVFGSLTVVENLTVIARTGGETADPWTVDRVFDFFPRLAERRRHRAKNLSGGEQQMLAIGRALMTNPTMLVMDEASEGLAPAVLQVIKERLLALRESGLGVFFVEQNVGMAKALADRIYLLGSEGVIAWEGTPAEFEEAEAVKREHLGV